MSIVQNEAKPVTYKNFYKHKCNSECQKNVLNCNIPLVLAFFKSLKEGLLSTKAESHHSSDTSMLCLFRIYLSDKKEHVSLFFDFRTGFRQSLFKSIHSLSLRINVFV
jgi:hypothetical protein